MFIEETLEDRQLMLSLKNGNSGSFDILHQRHRLRVFHLISRITNDAAAAEELSQEVFLRVYMARARYQPSASFSTWLYRIAFNRSLNWLRSQGPGKSTLSYDALPAAGWSALRDPATPEHLLLRRERIQRVRAALAALSPASGKPCASTGSRASTMRPLPATWVAPSPPSSLFCSVPVSCSSPACPRIPAMRRRSTGTENDCPSRNPAPHR